MSRTKIITLVCLLINVVTVWYAAQVYTAAKDSLESNDPSIEWIMFLTAIAAVAFAFMVKQVLPNPLNIITVVINSVCVGFLGVMYALSKDVLPSNDPNIELLMLFSVVTSATLIASYSMVVRVTKAPSTSS